MGDKMGRFLTFLLAAFAVSQASVAQVVVSEPVDLIVVHGMNTMTAGPTNWWFVGGTHVVRRDYAGNYHELGNVLVQVSGDKTQSTCFALANNASESGRFVLRIKSGQYTFAPGGIEPKIIIKVDDLRSCTKNEK